MRPIAVDDNTGEVFMLSPQGEWRPVPSARDPQTKETWYLNGDQWQRVPNQRPPEDTKLQRFATGLGDVYYGGAQFLANNLPSNVRNAAFDAVDWLNRQPVAGPITRWLGITPTTAEQINERVAQREAQFRDLRERQGLSPDGFDPYRLAGNITATLPLMKLGAARTLAGAALQGATIGTGLGAATPIDAEGDEYRNRLMENLRFGAMAGGIGGAAGNFIGRALAPRIDPKVQRLHEAGVELTPGQVMGGTARKIEDQLASYPLGIDVARRRGIESFNRAVANEVLEPIGKSVPRNAPVGRELVESVKDAISSAYDDALSRIPPLRRDEAFEQVLHNIKSRPLHSEASQETFQRAFDQDVLPFLKGNTIDARSLKNATSQLRTLAREYRKDPNIAQRQIADAFDDAHKALMDLVAQRAPDAAPRLKAADAAYARFVRMQTAAGMQGATDGVFSPAHFSHAVRQADESVRRGAYASGNALMQDLSDAGRAVLPQTVPDSGTPGRTAIGLLLGGGAYSMFDTMTPLAAFLASRTLYSRPVNQAIVNTMLAPRPAPVIAAGEAVRTMGAPVVERFWNMPLSVPPETMR